MPRYPLCAGAAVVRQTPTWCGRRTLLGAALARRRPVQQSGLLVRRRLGTARAGGHAHHLSAAQTHLAVRRGQQRHCVVETAGAGAAQHAASRAGRPPPRRVRVGAPRRRRRRRRVRLHPAVGHQRGVQQLLRLRVGPRLRLLQDGLLLLGAAVPGVGCVSGERTAAAVFACRTLAVSGPRARTCSSSEQRSGGHGHKLHMHITS